MAGGVSMGMRRGTAALKIASERWWRAWCARFGLAEVRGALTALSGFAAGYLATGSLLVAAGMATMCEAIGFYGCLGVKTTAAASRVTAHLAGFRRLAAGTWHAVTGQLASCAAAEALDAFLVRPGCLARGVAGPATAGWGMARVRGRQARRRRGLLRHGSRGSPGPGPVGGRPPPSSR
jgi:hypothetical protein